MTQNLATQNTSAAAPAAILPAANQWFQQRDPGYYPGQVVAGFNPIQRNAWDFGQQAYSSGIQAANQNRQQANGLVGMFQQGIAANPNGTVADTGLGDVGAQYLNMLTADEINGIQGNFEVNPYVNDQVAAYQQAFTRGFQRSLPQHSVDAMLAGQMGSSRHGIAEGLARSDFQRQLGEGTAALTNQAWDQAAGRQVQARGQTLQALAADRSRGTNAAVAQANNRANIGMSNSRNQLGAYQSRMGALSSIPSLMSSLTNTNMLPSQVRLDAANYARDRGNQYQQLAQRQIDGEINRWNDRRFQGLDRLQSYISLINGSGTSNYGNRPQVGNAPNTFGQLLGVAGSIGTAMALRPPPAPSDERLKENIKPVDSALEKLLAMRGVEWTWKADGTRDIGVIAQEVEAVLEDAVSRPDEYRRVDYTKVTALALEAIRELKNMIEVH